MKAKPLDVRQRAKLIAAGERWFSELPTESRFALGDDFVLGTFDWRDWFEEKPSKWFLEGAERARLLWECEER